MDLHEYPTAPWRILRPFSWLLGAKKLDLRVGDRINTFIAEKQWAHVVDPGEPIELADRDTLEVWITGRVVYAKKVALKDLSIEDLRHSVMFFFLGGEITPQAAAKSLSEYYGEDISAATTFAVVSVLIEKLNIPPEALADTGRFPVK